MATYNTLKELFTDICNAIREKNGTTGTIKHNEIADNIRNLSSAGFDTSQLVSMYYMFSKYPTASLDLSNFDTSNATNMSYMFYQCKLLTSLDLSNFDTSKVTDMSSMFASCSSLTSLDLSNFDTSKVTNVGSMFASCSSLTLLKIGSMFVKNTDLSTIAMFTTATNQNINLDFNGYTFCAKAEEVILNLTTIWRGTDETKIACYESFANSLGTNTTGYTRTIKIYTKLYNALTDTQKALVTDKGYMLSAS